MTKDELIAWFKANGVPHPAIEDRRGVGRNEPCPCGSGKKFKKCGGRS